LDQAQYYSHPSTLTAERKKSLGIVYTPEEYVHKVVQQALDLWKENRPPKVLDLGCGTGIFMKVVKELRPDAIVHGCDIDEQAVKIAQANGHNAFVSSFLDMEERYDIVVGNPPYVRIQNLDSKTREQVNSLELTEGDTDLYLAAIEWALKHADIVSFIAPSSWTINNSARKLRQYISNNQLLYSLHDYGDEQLFDGVLTYVAIATFHKCSSYTLTRGDKTTTKTYPVNNLCFEDTTGNLLDICDIRVGLATLADGVFYTKEKYSNSVPCVKASRTQIERNWIIFPYENGRPIEEDDLGEDTHDYLCQHYDRLMSRSSTGPQWYTYGRTQGFNTYTPKVLIPPAQKDIHGIILPDEVCFYISGYAAFPKSVSLEELYAVFTSKEMHEFVHDRGKPMSGGYKGINKTILTDFSI